ncbi:hypothetical protein [Bifidobacterium pseudolongum]|uniref:hypothetical protein n=1 Tax=Bifidobacterium pseudolongum TaxID=1694 RepID=UPI001177F82F|nr:hypothetical protein [Bifidobacterium pseudolongum]
MSAQMSARLSAGATGPICPKNRCRSVISDDYQVYLSQKSLLHRFFGQLQRVVMLSGPEYDFRQGCTDGKGHTAWVDAALALVGA